MIYRNQFYTYELQNTRASLDVYILPFGRCLGTRGCPSWDMPGYLVSTSDECQPPVRGIKGWYTRNVMSIASPTEVFII